MKLLMVFIVLSLTSCGMILGVKEVRTAGGTVVKFNSGFGAEASFTESDELSNSRGIRPTK